jgi:hypothetical protein
MPEDPIATGEDADEAPVVHDDIMKRLLDYQRRLRDGSGSDGLVEQGEMQAARTGTVTATEDLVDLTEIEEPEVEVVEPSVVEPSEPEPTDVVLLEGPVEAEPAEVVAAAGDEDLRERLDRIAGSLARIASMLAAVRQDFQDLAVQADERIAEIEDALAAARRSGDG